MFLKIKYLQSLELYSFIIGLLYYNSEIKKYIVDYTKTEENN